jgi:hypothetical protein
MWSRFSNGNASKTHCKNGHEFTPENTGTQRNGTGRYCRVCRRSFLNEHREEYQNNAQQNNPEKVRTQRKRDNVKAHFGISLEEYEARLLAQNNLCALCHKPFEGTGWQSLAPALDHNHKSGRLREFLHNVCNKGIGLLGDNPEMCRMATEYLEKHREIENGDTDCGR